MAPTSETLADGRERSRISNYNAFWQKDLLKEASVDTENRLDNYTDVVNGMCSRALRTVPYLLLTGTWVDVALRLLRWCY